MPVPKPDLHLIYGDSVRQLFDTLYGDHCSSRAGNIDPHHREDPPLVKGERADWHTTSERVLIGHREFAHRGFSLSDYTAAPPRFTVRLASLPQVERPVWFPVGLAPDMVPLPVERCRADRPSLAGPSNWGPDAESVGAQQHWQ